MHKGLKYKLDVFDKIDRIVQSPTKRLSKSEAIKILRSCGILNRDNDLNEAYKEILSREVSNDNEKQ